MSFLYIKYIILYVKYLILYVKQLIFAFLKNLALSFWLLFLRHIGRFCQTLRLALFLAKPYYQKVRIDPGITVVFFG